MKPRVAVRKRADGTWEVVDAAEKRRRDELTPGVEAKPRPSPADDPRTGNERRMPGLPGGL
jgi:hypothetical protein